jgi:hypothetical protein
VDPLGAALELFLDVRVHARERVCERHGGGMVGRGWILVVGVM